ncbi:MAG: MTH938/NDUFAF3 family protein [Pseudomonadota bacterium]
MQFAKENQPPNAISRYDANSIWIRDQQHIGSLAIAQTEVLSDWRCRSVDDLSPALIQPLLDLKPQVIVLATGERPVFPQATLMQQVMLAGVGIEVMNDGAAVRTFNVLLGEARPSVLALVR